MANNLLTMSYITNEALVVLENELVIANRVERQYSAEFAQTGAKIGATCNVRRPPRYKGTYGPPLNVEDTNESSVQVSLNYQFHVDIQFTTQDLALSMDMFKKRVLKPQIATVANRIDSDTAQYAYLNTAALLGTPGVSPNSLKIFTDARAILAAEACPREGEKNAVLDPISMSSMVATVQGLFNPQAKIGEYIEAGMIAREFGGLDWWEDQNIPVYTTGAQGGTPVLTTPVAGTAFLASGWAQSGTVSTQGWTASTAVVQVGDVIQFAGVLSGQPAESAPVRQDAAPVRRSAAGWIRGPGKWRGPSGAVLQRRDACGRHVQPLDRRLYLERHRHADADHRRLRDLRRSVPERHGGPGIGRHDHGQRRNVLRQHRDPAVPRVPQVRLCARLRGPAAAAGRGVCSSCV